MKNVNTAPIAAVAKPPRRMMTPPIRDRTKAAVGPSKDNAFFNGLLCPVFNAGRHPNPSLPR
jgi:hypothetical protein